MYTTLARAYQVLPPKMCIQSSLLLYHEHSNKENEMKIHHESVQTKTKDSNRK